MVAEIFALEIHTYIYIHTYTKTYIYIYVCVCVCSNTPIFIQQWCTWISEKDNDWGDKPKSVSFGNQEAPWTLHHSKYQYLLMPSSKIIRRYTCSHVIDTYAINTNTQTHTHICTRKRTKYWHMFVPDMQRMQQSTSVCSPQDKKTYAIVYTTCN